MKTYLIEVSKRVEVKAERRQDAIQEARKQFYSDEIKDNFEFKVITDWDDEPNNTNS